MKENYELREVTINEWIWIVFVILSLANIYGDELEKSSLQEELTHNNTARKIFLTTASVALIIYFYFAIHSYNKLKILREQNKDTKLQEINLLGNSLVFIGACILIYFNIQNRKEKTNDLT